MEIICALGVLAILAVLLMSALGRARERAQATLCTQKLRQIGVANTAYIAEHNGALIPYASISGTPMRFWFDELDIYMGEEPYDFDRTHPHAWQLCPSKPVQPESRASVGYGWNHRHFGYTRTDPRGGMATIHQVARPSETVIIGDSLDIPREGPIPAASSNRYLYGHAAASLARRHGGKGFYLLLDGRVLAATPEEIVETGQGPYRRYWTKSR